MSLFTLGRATEAGKSCREAGIRLHAASGRVRVRAVDGAARLATVRRRILAGTHADLTPGAGGMLPATAASAARVNLYAGLSILG